METPWGALAVSDAHIHFFSHRFFAALAEQKKAPVDSLAPVLGWLFTAFAATLGAPFWFDVLNQIMVIRSTVKPHEKSGEEASLDRQTKPPSQQPTLVATVPQMAANQQLDSNDLCGVGEIIATPDDQLPPALGGVS